MAAPREAALPAALGAGAVTRRRRPASEAALVRAAQGGSAEAMEELFRRHWPAAHRAVIVMRHLLGFTPGEIATALGLPRGTVNSRLRRGLDALREPLSDEDGR